ncbi:MAG: acyl--CoA ligase [Lachnospiraceae bacterium]|nr:acyl--CoA ligase [Lachnospiraceae bacterium]
MIEKTRVTEVTLYDDKRVRHFLFDADGVLREEDSDNGSDWLKEALASFVSQLPDVSCNESIRLRGPEGRLVVGYAEKYMNMTVGKVLDYNTSHYPDQEVIVDAELDVHLTAGEFARMTDKVARHFMDFGLKRGDTCAVIMRNNWTQFIAKYAALQCGAIATNISPFESDHVLTQLLQHTETSIVVGKHDETIDQLKRIMPDLENCEPGNLNLPDFPCLKAVFNAGDEEVPGMLRLKDLLETEPRTTQEELQARKDSVQPSDIATIIHTSGTTGTPKSVMLRHSACLENAYQHVLALNITRKDRLFVPVPMFHAMGAIGSAMTSLVAGSTTVCLRRPKSKDVLEALVRERCTVALSVPSFFIDLVKQVEESNFDTSGLQVRLCVMAGAQCTEKCINDTRNILGIKDVLVMYGMTEAGPGVSSTVADDSMDVKTHTVGKPWPGTEVKLDNTYVDDDGLTKGEICVRGYNVMAGFFHDSKETAKTIDRRSWLHTGDIGSFRPDGNLMICGRIKDIIIKRGENVSPTEIEGLMESYPDVREAIAVGAKDDDAGEAIYVFVTSDKEIDEQKIKDYCVGRISLLKIPDRIIQVDDFPKSGTGKILRKELRKTANEMNLKKGETT